MKQLWDVYFDLLVFEDDNGFSQLTLLLSESFKSFEGRNESVLIKEGLSMHFLMSLANRFLLISIKCAKRLHHSLAVSEVFRLLILFSFKTKSLCHCVQLLEGFYDPCALEVLNSILLFGT